MEICIEKYEEGIIIRKVRDFNLKHIFDCGQCFRWKEEEETYTGVVKGRVVSIKKCNEDVYIQGGRLEDRELWIDYFDLNRDYGVIKEELSKDEILREAIGHGEGIRILNQEPFETTISFIISANNRIPMIKRAVENISKKFGRSIIFEGKEYFSFPEPWELAKAREEDLKGLGCGFRAPYIVEATREISSGIVDLNAIRKLDTDEAHSKLMELKGVGPKVADCIMLFSMGKSSAFPVDVWVKRVMQYFYLAPDISLKKIRDYGRDKFGELSGIAQQYLFYYARDLKGKEGLEK